MSTRDRRLVIGYLELRKTLGVLAVLFPILLAGYCVIFGSCIGLRNSISAYYSTDSRDLFVGILFSIALFLFVYKGYDNVDDRMGDIAGVSALGVALFPSNNGTEWVGVVHFVSAILLFLTLSTFCLLLFPKKKKDAEPTQRKLMRNRVYYANGAIILLCMVLIGGYYAILQGTAWVDDLKPVFFLEALALWAFGLSWFVKGEAILADSAP